jgi:ribosomal protein L11 methyltransferase
MMETMLEIDFKGKTILDMGCGTGILAILASKRGASAIRAIDTDRWAINAVKENIIINHTLNITPAEGDASMIGSMKFDILLVNIQKNVILTDMTNYSEALNPGGTILFSGFFEADLPGIIASAESQGLTFLSKKERNNWVVAVFKAG